MSREETTTTDGAQPSGSNGAFPSTRRARSPEPETRRRASSEGPAARGSRLAHFADVEEEVAEEAAAGRQVSGYTGSFDDAVANGLIPAPHLMGWNTWQQWRKGAGRRPTKAVDGFSTETLSETELWRASMVTYHGAYWRSDLQALEQQAQKRSGVEGRSSAAAAGPDHPARRDEEFKPAETARQLPFESPASVPLDRELSPGSGVEASGSPSPPGPGAIVRRSSPAASETSSHVSGRTAALRLGTYFDPAKRSLRDYLAEITKMNEKMKKMPEPFCKMSLGQYDLDLFVSVLKFKHIATMILALETWEIWVISRVIQLF